ncbi:hypothetical protein [Deinococcus ruber]|uniref:Uncharacterized protein n=1 Tax=Deinococcus ruber TaxID=1848197 RepID=A0A918CLY6_9DEIO|nr:hypothetical protein [Deinococcus ruber]GGR29664.1 hypothetical protein GCM10008957_45770 [Deinococcus ruber]
MFRFALLLLVLSSSIVCAWLDRKHLLRGQGVRVALTLLLCVLFVPLLLFLVFSAVAYSFRGAAFEMTMTVLIAALGLGCVIWGAVIKTRAAIVLLSAGVVELVTLFLAWLVPLSGG